MLRRSGGDFTVSFANSLQKGHLLGFSDVFADCSRESGSFFHVVELGGGKQSGLAASWALMLSCKSTLGRPAPSTCLVLLMDVVCTILLEGDLQTLGSHLVGHLIKVSVDEMAVRTKLQTDGTLQHPTGCLPLWLACMIVHSVWLSLLLTDRRRAICLTWWFLIFEPFSFGGLRFVLSQHIFLVPSPLSLQVCPISYAFGQSPSPHGQIGVQCQWMPFHLWKSP